jgi:hypothetical protein
MLFILFFSNIHGFSKEANVKAKEFYSLCNTRGWELGMWRLSNEDNKNDTWKLFKLSMTAQAFRYWVLASKGIIDQDLVHEAQIRRSFSSGKLDINSLKNPLSKNEDYQGGFDIGYPLTLKDYSILSIEFEKFINSK